MCRLDLLLRLASQRLSLNSLLPEALVLPGVLLIKPRPTTEMVVMGMEHRKGQTMGVAMLPQAEAAVVGVALVRLLIMILRRILHPPHRMEMGFRVVAKPTRIK